MWEILRGRSRSAKRHWDVLEVAISDVHVAHLDHYCPGTACHRLLGVAFSDAEREELDAGLMVTIAMGCDACIWARQVAFLIGPDNRV